MKHAYLIMAHNEPQLLRLLLSRLDDEHNDIYLHLDKKMKCNPSEFCDCVKHSRIFPVDRTNVCWGGYSQINCELLLLKAATKGNYDYYHLITGVCLPIKSNDEILSFFEQNNGCQFIHFDDNVKCNNRYNRYHFAVNSKIRNKVVFTLLKGFERVFNLFFGNRTKRAKDTEFKYGGAYFDITHGLAMHVLSQEKKIRKLFRLTSCCDEVFLQTVAYASPYRDSIRGYMRFVKWCGKSNPSILTEEHYDEIVSSDRLFARKFSLEKSKRLIEKLYCAPIDELIPTPENNAN